MLITSEKIEMWKKDPSKWDYDRGYNKVSLDSWNQPDPIVFTDKHSKAFRFPLSRCTWLQCKMVL